MYSNQLCHVKWEDETSASFSISNGVKQGGVISPLPFSLYIDELFLLLKQSGLGCHVGLTYDTHNDTHTQGRKTLFHKC